MPVEERLAVRRQRTDTSSRFVRDRSDAWKYSCLTVNRVIPSAVAYVVSCGFFPIVTVTPPVHARSSRWEEKDALDGVRDALDRALVLDGLAVDGDTAHARKARRGWFRSRRSVRRGLAASYSSLRAHLKVREYLWRRGRTVGNMNL